MFTDYSKYCASDFLNDDYFIDSMISTTPESQAFWKSLFDENKININEFISAYRTIESLQESKPKVLDEKIEKLWDRIVTTNAQRHNKRIRFRIFRNVAIAASFIGLIGLTLFKFILPVSDNSTLQIADYAKKNIIHSQQPIKQIQLITEDETLDVVGKEAKVEYDKDGKVKVNEQSISQNRTSQSNLSEVKYNQLRLPYGKRAILNLSDGTKLWVNTGTTVIYPTSFSKDKREIFIEGEVYAEVSHDSSRPFIIKTEKLDVNVLGTVFNVTAYKEDKQTDVVLVSGSVSVKPQSGKPTLIKPNQLYSYSSQSTTLRNIDVENYTSWHDGNLIFKSEPIENILIRLSRYYNVTMELPSSPSGISCSGKLELKDNLNELLNGLSEITSMNFAVKNNGYRIKFE